MRVMFSNLGRNKITREIDVKGVGLEAVKRYIKRELLDGPFEVCGTEEPCTYQVIQGDRRVGMFKCILNKINHDTNNLHGERETASEGVDPARNGC